MARYAKQTWMEGNPNGCAMEEERIPKEDYR